MALSFGQSGCCSVTAVTPGCRDFAIILERGHIFQSSILIFLSSSEGGSVVATQTLSLGQIFLFKRLFETEAEPRALGQTMTPEILAKPRSRFCLGASQK